MNYANPFPGMDPYLEQPQIWPGFHNHLVSTMAFDLGARVPHHYRVDIEERTEVAAVYGAASDLVFMIPDALVTERPAAPAFGDRPDDAGTTTATATAVAPPERGIAVRVAMPEEVRVTRLYVQRMPEARVVTIVEVLSPSHKAPGAGRDNYLSKRGEILNSGVSLVEIDLLRRWEPMPLETPPPPGDYRILVCRGWERPAAVLYPFSVRQAVPKFTLPLLRGDAGPDVELGALINRVHRLARYGQIARYNAPPPGPPFDAGTQEWVAGRLESLLRPPATERGSG